MPRLTFATCLLLLTLLLSLMLNPDAQTEGAGKSRLRLVVRNPLGTPIPELGVRYYQRGEDWQPKLHLDAKTNQLGILDSDTKDWPSGEYLIELYKRRPGQVVEPPLRQRSKLNLLIAGRDEWVMLILYPDGRIAHDLSYSLRRRPEPQPPAPSPPTYGWTTALARRGLTTDVLTPISQRPPATAEAAVTRVGQAYPLPASAPPSRIGVEGRQNPSGDPGGYFWLGLGIVAVGIIVWRRLQQRSVNR